MFRTAILVSLAIFLFGVVSEMSYEDAVREENQYCELVGDGTWPDYKGIYEEVCVNE